MQWMGNEVGERWLVMGNLRGCDGMVYCWGTLLLFGTEDNAEWIMEVTVNWQSEMLKNSIISLKM